MPKIIFNPFTSNFDITSTGDAPPPVTVENYVQAFNGTTDWTLNGDYYEIEVDVAIHEHGLAPQVQVFELVVADYYQVQTEVLVGNDGLVTIQVLSTPDLRFEGKLIIS